MDYEFFKLLSCIELPKLIEPTAMLIINGFAIIILASSDGLIYFIHFKKSELKL